MSLKLKDFITELRACKTTKEEKEFILKETANIRQSFQKNEHNYKPRNLVKLLFINLQGFNCDFGQIESLNLSCRSSFIEKKIGYLTMSFFLHEKSEMLMMATNRISLDLDHSNPYVREIALSAFTVIADQDMARMLSPKIKALLISPSNSQQGRQNSMTQPNYANALKTEDPSLNQLVKKKAFLAVLRIVQKCPDLIVDYIPVMSNVFREKDHGLLLAAVPVVDKLYHEIFESMRKESENEGQENEISLSKNQMVKRFLLELNDHVLCMIDKIKSLLGYADPDYSVNGVNDPFLLISMLQFLKNILVRTENCGYAIETGIQKAIQSLVTFVLANTRQNKKTINAVLYELAQLALVFGQNQEQVTAAFAILNQLIEIKDTIPNFKFVALNLIQSSQGSNDKFLKMLSSQCELIIEVLREEDVSLKVLALKVLPQISTEQNVDKLLGSMKEVLADEMRKTRTSSELEQAVVNNIFQLFENKMNEQPAKRVEKSIDFLLLYSQEIRDSNLASLIALIVNSEELQVLSIKKMWEGFRENWASLGLFKIATYIFGECCEIIEKSKVGFELDDLLVVYENIYRNVSNSNNKSFLLNSLAKILGKKRLDGRFEKYRHVLVYFARDFDLNVQSRAAEFLAILENKDLTDFQKTEIFTSIPIANLKTNAQNGGKKLKSLANLPATKKVEDDSFLGIDFKQDTSVQNKPGTNLDLFENTHTPISVVPTAKTIFSDDEISVCIKSEFAGLTYTGTLILKNRTSQNLSEVIVQIIGISNASVNFKGAKWNSLGMSEEKSVGFTVSPLSVESHDVKLKFVAKFYYENSEKLEDFRFTKDGLFTLQDSNNFGTTAAAKELNFDFGKETSVNKGGDVNLLDLEFF